MHSANNDEPLAVETTADATVVRFTRADVDLDFETTPRLRERLGPLVAEMENDLLVLDFTNVAFLSSVALGALVSLHKQARAAGKHLRLTNVSDAVHEVFEVTRLTAVLDIRRAGAGSAPPAVPG